MRGKRKRFDPDLAVWAKAAEGVVRGWLRTVYAVTEKPHGECDVDFAVEGRGEHFDIEVERRHSWMSGPFHFPNVHVPERRARYKDTMLLSLRDDMNHGVVIFGQSLTADRLHEVSNKFHRSGEYMYCVPLLEVLPVDLTVPMVRSLAEMNARRIRQGSDDLGYFIPPRDPVALADYRLRMLGAEPPYGISDDEFRELQRQFTAPISRQVHSVQGRLW